MFAAFGAIALGTLAVSTVYIGSHLAIVRKQFDDEGEEEQYMELTYTQILLFPVTASVMLVILFFFHELTQYFLLLIVTTAVSLALYDCLKQGFLLHVYPGRTETSTTLSASCAILTAACVLDWFLRGSFLSHDILGCAMCIQFISIVRFPSLRLAMLCLSILFVYDFFWVFHSQHYDIFGGKNVMVEVATKPTSNPFYVVGSYLDWSWLKGVGREHVELPLKLIFPVGYSEIDTGTRMSYTMLGLGDITIPGLLVAYANTFDHNIAGIADDRKIIDIENALEEVHDLSTTGKRKSRLAEWTIFGYIVGLLLAFLASACTSKPQPALVYIVPAILVTLCYRARKMGCLDEVWKGLHLVHSE